MSKLLKAGGLLLVAACFAAPALGDDAPATPAPAAAPAPATTATPAPATVAAAAPKSTTPKLVCEDDSEIGSHLHKRIFAIMTNLHNDQRDRANRGSGPK